MFYTVNKIKGGYQVQDWAGGHVIAYRDKATAEKVATSCTKGLFTAAEEYDRRRSSALQYLAQRAQRVPANANQMELF